MSETDANGWMPIETAPSDGSEFLVWFPKQKEIGYGFYAQGAFGYPETFRFFWFDVEESADPYEPDDQPSLWQPLPKHPSQSREAGTPERSNDDA